MSAAVRRRGQPRGAAVTVALVALTATAIFDASRGFAAWRPASAVTCSRGASRSVASRATVTVTDAVSLTPEDLVGTQLEALAGVTTLSIDTGDLDVIKEYAATGLISDATTNPLFVSQAGLSGDPRYVAFVQEALDYSRGKLGDVPLDEIVNLAMDRLSVNLGKEIVSLVPGYVSTEVDIRESFDVQASVDRARRIIGMYEESGVPRSRVLIKLAATWEGIKAAEILEKEGITCNLTLVFGFTQAVACAQAGVRLISPFPGRVLDWHKNNGGQPAYSPDEDPGVVAVRRMYDYYKKFGHGETICMPASWRPSRGAGFETDEITALAGVDRMTIPPSLLEKLAASREPLPRLLDPSTAEASCRDAEVAGGALGEKQFRMMMNADVCATTKLAEGINAFVDETEKLRVALASQL